MALGAVGEGLRRATGSAASTTGSLMLSPGNLEILVAKLSRMRGAALKLGQMISFQGMLVNIVILTQLLTLHRHKDAAASDPRRAPESTGQCRLYACVPTKQGPC